MCKFVFNGFDAKNHADFELVPRLIGRKGCNLRPISQSCRGGGGGVSRRFKAFKGRSRLGIEGKAWKSLAFHGMRVAKRPWSRGKIRVTGWDGSQPMGKFQTGAASSP